MHNQVNDMYINSTQCLGKIMNSLRIAPLQFYLITAKMSTAKSESHYDTLEIQPRATQGEIKAAYYKLSMLYHPDRNKSEHAKRKFQNITAAYEVLGNYEERKQYDKTMRIRYGPPIDRHIKVTRDPMSSPSKHYSSKIYDFDEWTKQHYGFLLQKRLEKKRGKEEYVARIQKQRHREAESIPHMEQIMTIILIALVLLAYNNRSEEKVETNKKQS